MPTRRITTRHYPTPCGSLLLGSFGNALCLCDWVAGKHHTRTLATLQRHLQATAGTGDSPTLQQACAELDACFRGSRIHFRTPLLPLGSSFRLAVWQELLRIPCGCTTSYGELARQLGKPSAARAVASAIGANALSLFIPCHRVIGSRGSLGGYRGGLQAKRFLLEQEQALPGSGPAASPCPSSRYSAKDTAQSQQNADFTLFT